MEPTLVSIIEPRVAIHFGGLYDPNQPGITHISLNTLTIPHWVRDVFYSERAANITKESHLNEWDMVLSIETARKLLKFEKGVSFDCYVTTPRKANDYYSRLLRDCIGDHPDLFCIVEYFEAIEFLKKSRLKWR